MCGNIYTSRMPQGNVCNDCKNKPCEICGKPFLHVWPYDQRACSAECRHKLRTDKNNIAQKEAKRKATVLKKYGVDNVSKIEGVRTKIAESKSNSEKYNVAKMQAVSVAKANKSPIIRNCVICGKEFEATGSQTTCQGPHIRKCKICGKEFEYKHISDKRTTCSRECWSLLRKKSLASIKRICAFCGKEFYSESNTAKYCSEKHCKKCKE